LISLPERKTLRVGILRAIIMIPFILLFLTSNSRAAETVPLKIIVNTMDKGERLIIMTPGGDLLFSKEQLKELGFKDMPEKALLKEDGLVSLKSLSPEVIFVLSMQEAALLITAKPTLLEKTVIDMGYNRPEKVTYPKENSAFLNYAASYSMGDKFDFNALSIPAETGVRIGDYLFYSNSAYTETKTDKRFERLMTNITRDDTQNIIRYTAGDLFASSGGLGGGSILGGVSVTKNFSLNPYVTRYPGLNQSGLLQTPSEVEFYVNGVLMKKEKLPPGTFDISNLSGQTGAGNATIVSRP
jgi:outer membrane usher protein